MNRTTTTRRFSRSALALLLGIGLVLTAAPSWAERNERSDHADRRQVTVVKRLPAGHRTVRVHDIDYAVADGRYYRREAAGLVLVPPPIGAVVLNLPAGRLSINLGGVAYFRSGDVYFRAARHGYEVVAPPPVQIRAARDDLRIVVRAALLNVHSGPARNAVVINQVHSGSRLVVTAQAPGWYRVRLPGGGQGWIMSKYAGSAAAG